MIWRSQKTTGISVPAQFMDLFVYSMNVVYNIVGDNPFSTWGESFFMTLQMLTIVILMLWLDGRIGFLLVSLAAYVCMVVPATMGLVPVHILTLLQGV